MPGVPAAPVESVFGRTSFVHDLPPSIFSTNCTAGRSTRELHAVLVAGDAPSLGRLARRRHDPAAARARAPVGQELAARPVGCRPERREPLGEPRPRGLATHRAADLRRLEGLAVGREVADRRARRLGGHRARVRARRSSFAFAVLDAASRGRLFVWLTSEVSVDLALTVFVDFAASAVAPSAVSSSSVAPAMTASDLETAFGMCVPFVVPRRSRSVRHRAWWLECACLGIRVVARCGPEHTTLGGCPIGRNSGSCSVSCPHGGPRRAPGTGAYGAAPCLGPSPTTPPPSARLRRPTSRSRSWISSSTTAASARLTA